MEQLQIPEFPKVETCVVQRPLWTPIAIKLAFSIWEVDEEPDQVMLHLEARDSDGELLVLRCGPAPRNEGWGDALSVGRLWIDEAWYETHGPF